MFGKKQQPKRSEPVPPAQPVNKAESSGPLGADTEAESHQQTPTDRPQSRAFERASTSFIGEGLLIEGTIEGAEDMVVEGRVVGGISLPDHHLTVAAAGSLDTELLAAAATVEGCVIGDVRASDLVTIAAGGDVQGDIRASRVALEDGARFKGSIDMDAGAAVGSSLPVEPPVDAAHLKTA